MAKSEIITKETTVATQEELASEGGFALARRIVYFAFGLVNGLLLLRFVFRLLGASSASGFVRFLYETTDIFMAPFQFIFRTDVVEGAVFEWSALVAVAIYLLLNWVAVQLISIAQQSKGVGN